MASEEKIARLLGLLLTREMENRADQVAVLRSAGFDVPEVASLLGISQNNVSVTDYQGRKKRKAR